ncbi:hypothetical protein KPL70_020962 [Citrus sinensis]|uniref:Uncharacterized protein n=1 Tax=Citrus clementina TaxID=85681 RepID=V4SUC8_CITCL|nr:hypothetical protein CICLE_v10027162mg [Citrus x clementina]KAH9667250.1 hypothetical protein KPL70_020962 [Citrus sinensis]
MSSDPDSYTPQEVAIGPYHYWRQGLYEMITYKLVQRKELVQAQRHIDGDHKFQYVVEQLKELELKIRACYLKFLNFSKLSATTSSISMLRLLDYAGTKAAHNAILRDMVILENQIPLFVLRKKIKVQYSSLESADDILQAMLLGFCQELLPFQILKDIPKINVSERAHLLDFLYGTIVPKAEQKSEITEVADDQGEDKQATQKYFGDQTYIKKIIQGDVELFLSKPLKLFFKLPWTVLSKLPLISILAQLIQYMLFPEENKSDDEGSYSSNSDMNKPPLVEEITIPSVTELYKSSVSFSATNGNILTISFDTNTATLHLPSVSLDVNSKVILRNLVAYEASNASGTLVFTRYTELMNGIIDTEEDVKLLRRKGILLNRLKSDAEVADLWNGMSKSIKLTKVPHLNKVIEDVNNYYNNRLTVRFWKYTKLYVFSSWQFFTLLATNMLLLLMIWQAFCSIYNCRKFNIISDSD